MLLSINRFSCIFRQKDYNLPFTWYDYEKSTSQHTVMNDLANVERFIEFADLQGVGEVIFNYLIKKE